MPNKSLVFEGVKVTTSYKGRSIPQWLADFVCQAAKTSVGLARDTLERQIRLNYPAASQVAISDVARKVLAAGKRSRRIHYDRASLTWRWSN